MKTYDLYRSLQDLGDPTVAWMSKILLSCISIYDLLADPSILHSTLRPGFGESFYTACGFVSWIWASRLSYICYL